jgi:hypothetical protein
MADNAADAPPVTAYHYTPLREERIIRLLRIKEHEAGSLNLEVQSFLFHSLPEFEALSYTWGKAVLASGETEEDLQRFERNAANIVKKRIKIDGCDFFVQENLYDALHELPKITKGWLWIDAISINQMDLDERSHQVQLMGDIYSTAKRVVVWLGKDMLHVESVFDMQKYLPIIRAASSFEAVYDRHIKETTSMSLTDWNAMWKQHVKFHRRRRWFGRMWVVQEFAPRK